MTETVLEIKHLSKNFGKFKALKDINFELHAGEVLGFIGPNGAGKSTTIRTLLGLLQATGGSATIFGLDVWHDSVKIHRRLAYVPGDVYLWPNLTGGEVIDLLLKLGGQKHTTRTDELIRRFELDTSKKARTYSKGNRQKVAIIAALSTDADLYIFDEPTSGLDPLQEVIFQQEVLQLKEKGESVLLSSHILSEVEKMCDRVAIIRSGEIIEEGTLDSMRQFTRVQMSVTTKQSLTDLSEAAGVHAFELKGDNSATMQVEADHLEHVMADLGNLGILSIQSTPPTLEDLFMHYYEESGMDL